MNKAKNNLLFLLYTIILGVVVGVIIWGFLRVMNLGIDFLWSYLPSQFDFPLYTLCVCTVGGLLIGLWLFSRRNKLPYLWSLDRIMIVVAIGGAFVRFGNLFNSEIIGAPTDSPWGFIFARLYPAGTPVEAMVARHPAQIYEALCYIATFVVLMWLYYKRDMARRRPGLMFGVGLIGIFLTRFLIEFIKENQEAFEESWTLNMGQWLSVPFIVMGIALIVYAVRRPEVKPVAAAPAPKVASATTAPKTKKTKKRKW